MNFADRMERASAREVLLVTLLNPLAIRAEVCWRQASLCREILRSIEGRDAPKDVALRRAPYALAIQMAKRCRRRPARKAMR